MQYEIEHRIKIEYLYFSYLQMVLCVVWRRKEIDWFNNYFWYCLIFYDLHDSVSLFTLGCAYCFIAVVSAVSRQFWATLCVCLVFSPSVHSIKLIGCSQIRKPSASVRLSYCRSPPLAYAPGREQPLIQSLSVASRPHFSSADIILECV